MIPIKMGLINSNSLGNLHRIENIEKVPDSSCVSVHVVHGVIEFEWSHAVVLVFEVCHCLSFSRV